MTITSSGALAGITDKMAYTNEHTKSTKDTVIYLNVDGLSETKKTQLIAQIRHDYHEAFPDHRFVVLPAGASVHVLP